MALYPDDVAGCHEVIRGVTQQRTRAYDHACDLEIQLASAVAEIEALKARLEAAESTEPEGGDA